MASLEEDRKLFRIAKEKPTQFDRALFRRLFYRLAKLVWLEDKMFMGGTGAARKESTLLTPFARTIARRMINEIRLVDEERGQWLLDEFDPDGMFTEKRFTGFMGHAATFLFGKGKVGVLLIKYRRFFESKK